MPESIEVRIRADDLAKKKCTVCPRTYDRLGELSRGIELNNCRYANLAPVLLYGCGYSLKFGNVRGLERDCKRRTIFAPALRLAAPLPTALGENRACGLDAQSWSKDRATLAV